MFTYTIAVRSRSDMTYAAAVVLERIRNRRYIVSRHSCLPQPLLTMRHTFRLLALALFLTLPACVGAPVAPSIEETTFAPSLGVDLEASTRTTSGLYLRDVTVGAGATAAPGSKLNVHYVGALPSGFVFDKSEAGVNPPIAFTLGAGAVIRGWDEGIVGMRVGGRRQLIIPASLGYGDRGSGVIPPNSILVFMVDLVRID